jgi:hypothetical protein
MRKPHLRLVRGIWTVSGDRNYLSGTGSFSFAMACVMAEHWPRG